MGAIVDFAAIARRYCEWVEDAPNADDVLLVHKLLAELQLRALELPDVSCDDEYVDVGNREGSLEKVRDRLHTLPFEIYSQMFDVFADGEEPVCGALSDDLGDIYYDLREGLYFFDKGNENEAVWRWRLSYFSHWGRHLTGAQTALHQFFADQGGPIQTLSAPGSS